MIDDHVHPFPLAFEELELAGISLAGPPDGECRLATELLLTRLAGFLGCAPDQAVEARNGTARDGWTRYIGRLFDDAQLEGLVVDDGIEGAQRVATHRYEQVCGRPVWRLARLEPLIDRLLAEDTPAREIVRLVASFMTEQAADGCVGYKTVLAYRTGLAIEPDVDLAAAERSIDRAVPVRRRGKALRDLILRTACGIAADLGLPIQVHTGFGDRDIRLGESNPLLLEELLRTPEGAAATLVLIHGSHPWEAQAAYLATVRPNVHVELSLSNLFAPLGTADRLMVLLDHAPREKVLVGSDGHGAPETIWFGCRVLADAWSRVATHLRSAGARHHWVETTREAVFGDNARRLYRLSER